MDQLNTTWTREKDASSGEPLASVSRAPFVTPLSDTYTYEVFIGDLKGPFTQMSIGGRSPGGCGVTIEGDIECLVYHNSASILVPPTSLPGPYKQVAYGYDHACALDADGRASCWRVNDFGNDDDPELFVPCEKEEDKDKDKDKDK